MSKPFKETKLGKFLAGKGFNTVLETVGAVVPGVKLLDQVKDMVLGDPEAAAKLSVHDREEFINLYKLELQELEMLLQDAQSARTREADFVKATGHIDWFMTIFGGVILALFAYTVWVSSNNTISADMREIFIETRAAVRDIVVGIAAYYWGSSAGSRIKDMRK